MLRDEQVAKDGRQCVVNQLREIYPLPQRMYNSLWRCIADFAWRSGGLQKPQDVIQWMLEKCFDDTCCIYIAHAAGEAIGFIAGWEYADPWTPNDRKAHIAGMYVRAGDVVRTALLTAFYVWCENRRLDDITFMSIRKGMLRRARRFGFKPRSYMFGIGGKR